MMIISGIAFGTILGMTIESIGTVSETCSEPFSWSLPIVMGLFIGAFWSAGYMSRDCLDK